MKKLLFALVTAYLSLGLMVACGKGGGGGNGNTFLPGDGIIIDADGEENIKLSFYGETGASNGSAAKDMLRESYSPLYYVQQLNWSNLTDENNECFTGSFWKPKCTSMYQINQVSTTCLTDKEVWGDNWNAQARIYLCSSYTANMGLWFEVTTDNEFRVSLFGYNGYLNQSSMGGMYTTYVSITYDSNAREPINNGKGYRMTSVGGNGWPTWNKVLIIEVDNINENSTQATVRLKYGTSGNEVVFATFNVYKKPLL